MNVITGIIIGVLVALILLYFFKVFKVKESFANKITIIMVILVSFLSIYLYQQLYATNAAKDRGNLSKSINRVLTNSSISTIVTTNHINDNNTTRMAYMIDEMNAVSRPYDKRLDAINAEIDALMDALNEANENIFSEQIYTDKKQLNKSKIWLTKYSQYLNQSLVVSKELNQAQKDRFNSFSNIDSRFLSSVKIGFERGSNRSKELILKRYVASTKVVDKLTVLVSLADRNFGKVIVVNNTINFQKESDKNLYRNNLAELIIAFQDEEIATKELLDVKDSAIMRLTNVK